MIKSLRVRSLRMPIGVASLALAWSAGAAAQDLVISNARILDGDGGVIESGAVGVRDGRVVSVETSMPAVPGARRIDARGMTVMPAFTDGHRHLIEGDPDVWLREEAAERMRQFLAAGFTTVLSAGDPLEQILELRRRLEAGDIEGPRLLVAGRVPLSRGRARVSPDVDPARTDISRPPHRPTEPAGAVPPSETRAAVRAHVESGVDAIKTVIVVTPGGPEQDTLAAVAEEARRHGIPSITHAVTVRDTLAAVESGTHALVHTPHIGQLTDAAARRIAGAGIPMMSTLGIFVPAFGDDNEPLFRDGGPFPFETLSSAGQGPVNARLLWEAGVTYGFGTDTRYPPRVALEHELRPLRLAFSAQDIVTILTKNAASAVGLGDRVGTVEVGKLADLVVVDGDPWTDIHDVLNVQLVVKEGRIVFDSR